MKRRTLARVLGMVMVFAILPVPQLQAETDVPAAVVEAEKLQEQEEKEREEMLQQMEADYERFLQEKAERESKSKARQMRRRQVPKESYEEVLPITEEELSRQAQKQVEEAVQLSSAPEESAEKINTYGDAAYEVAVKEVLDGYYEDAGNVKQEELKAFSKKLDGRAEGILRGYEEALEERQNAGQLDYETETVMIMFEEGMTYEGAKEITDRISDKVLVLDGTGRTLEDCVSSQADEGNLRLIVGADIGISQTVGSVVEMLETVEGVDAAARNGYMEYEGIEDVNDPMRTWQYYLGYENVSDAWRAFTNSYVKNYIKTTVAVIDTGVDVDHKDLKDVISWDSVSYDYEGVDWQNPKKLFYCDRRYSTPHGTAVTGIIAANSNNGIGMTGITSIYDSGRNKVENLCDILAVHAVDVSDPSIHEYALVEGIRYAASHGADVINMSFGQYSAPNPILGQVIQEAHEANVVLVASAGNKNTSAKHYPSSYENVISVAALDVTGTQKASFSNYGEDTDISAVGDGMYLLKAGDSDGVLIDKGTSYSAPQVSAAAALIRAIYPGMSPDRVEFILSQTADYLDNNDGEEYIGYGRVNMGNAVHYAKILQFMYGEGNANEVKVEPKNPGSVEIDIEANPFTEMYEIKRAEGLNGEYKTIMTPGYWLEKDGHIIYQDENVEPGKTYHYMVRKRVYGYYNGMVTTYSRTLGPYSATVM